MNKVLITGGTGFIGSRLALQLVAEGIGVRVLAQRNTEAERANTRELEQAGIEIVDGSVTDPSALANACEGVDVVFHLAAAQHEANVPDSHYYEVNVEGTRNMLDAAVTAGVSRFVHGSTIGVYGTGGNGTVRDDSELDPDNIYGVTKLKGEEVVRDYFDRLPVSIVRISETYGPGDRRLLKLFKGVRKKKFFHIGPERNLHHLVFIDDLIRGMRLAATEEGAVGGTFVLAGPKAVTTGEMIASICGAAEVDVPGLRVPLWPLMATATVMEGVLRPLGIQPPLHRRRMNFFVKSFEFDCAPARERLGYAPSVSVDEGMRRTYEWYAGMNLLASQNGSDGGHGEAARHPSLNGVPHGDVTNGNGGQAVSEPSLSARMEPFDSFWEGPGNVEKGYRTFGEFYRVNYLKHVPQDRGVRILVISCGPGYFVNLLNQEGYQNVLGIDSYASKVEHALRHGLNCRVDTAFGHLQAASEPYDVVICEQELNHLTKAEMVDFLLLVRSKLTDGGRLICHGLNGANPIVGAETLAQNFDHFNTFTSYSLGQVLEYSGLRATDVFGLHLYVFYRNPMNYVAWAVSATMSVIFRAFFIIYGKENRIFTKKIAAVAIKD